MCDGVIRRKRVERPRQFVTPDVDLTEPARLEQRYRLGRVGERERSGLTGARQRQLRLQRSCSEQCRDEHPRIRIELRPHHCDKAPSWSDRLSDVAERRGGLVEEHHPEPGVDAVERSDRADARIADHEPHVADVRRHRPSRGGLDHAGRYVQTGGCSARGHATSELDRCESRSATHVRHVLTRCEVERVHRRVTELPGEAFHGVGVAGPSVSALVPEHRLLG